jgi:hypothetical protein
VALGIASWVLCYQVVVPSANLARPDGSMLFLPIGLLLAAGAATLFFVLDRRRPPAKIQLGGEDSEFSRKSDR